MPVDHRHPCCAVVDGALWVSPTPVPTAGASGPAGPVPRGRRGVLATGALAGAVLLVLTAVRGWGVDEVVALTVVALVGAVVGAATAVGVLRVVESDRRDDGGGVALPAGSVPLPMSVARAAPDDATGEELVLWATRALRLRRAREALLSGTGPEARGEPTTSVQARLGRAEEEHRAARRDWEPVGELLGLPDP